MRAPAPAGRPRLEKPPTRSSSRRPPGAWPACPPSARRPRLVGRARLPCSRCPWPQPPRSCPVQGELADVQVPGPEAGLGVAQVEQPHADEDVIEAERDDLVPAGVEPIPPDLQRLPVVRAEVIP